MSFNKTLEIFKIENPNWKIIKRIGDEGKDGLSYIIRHETNNVDGVVKLFKYKKSLNKIKNEYNLLFYQLLNMDLINILSLKRMGILMTIGDGEQRMMMLC